jgi:hypothetical protein
MNSHHRVALYRGGELRSVLEPEECRHNGVLGGGRGFADHVGMGDIDLDSAGGTGEREADETTEKG